MYPNFDQNAFEQQAANILLTLGSVVTPSMQCTGPVNVVNRKNDLVFCSRNCRYPTDQNQAVLAVFYPATSSGSRTCVAAGAWHSIAAHKSGPGSFAHTVSFLQAIGL